MERVSECSRALAANGNNWLHRRHATVPQPPHRPRCASVCSQCSHCSQGGPPQAHCAWSPEMAATLATTAPVPAIGRSSRRPGTSPSEWDHDGPADIRRRWWADSTDCSQPLATNGYKRLQQVGDRKHAVRYRPAAGSDGSVAMRAAVVGGARPSRKCTVPQWDRRQERRSRQWRSLRPWVRPRFRSVKQVRCAVSLTSSRWAIVGGACAQGQVGVPRAQAGQMSPTAGYKRRQHFIGST